MIYLLEDDDSIRKLVVYTLESQGFEARGFERPSLFWQAMDEACPELVLLDVMLPEEDGLSVLGKLREKMNTKGIPVIMLTAKDSEYDRVLGLDSGADDYIPKPFGMMELVARVRAVLRRVDTRPDAGAFRLGELYVDPEKHIVKAGGREVALTLKEFELLCALLQRQGAVLTRDALLERVWGYSFDGESRTVDVHIRTLRQKLGEAGECIETVRGVGYRIGDGNDR